MTRLRARCERWHGHPTGWLDTLTADEQAEAIELWLIETTEKP